MGKPEKTPIQLESIKSYKEEGKSFGLRIINPLRREKKRLMEQLNITGKRFRALIKEAKRTKRELAEIA